MSGPANGSDGEGEGRKAPPGMPRWVKVSGLVVLAVVVVIVVIMLLAGGEHGPGLHTGAADPSGIISAIASGRPFAS